MGIIGASFLFGNARGGLGCVETWQLTLIRASVIYMSIGLSLIFFVFLKAKVQDLDDRHADWYSVLNSVTGFLYFMVIGSVVWLPMFIMLLGERRGLRRSGAMPSWWRRFYTKIKVWLSEFYQ